MNVGETVYDPSDAVKRLLVNVPEMVADFRTNLMRASTREGMAVARDAGRPCGRKPELSVSRENRLVELDRTGALAMSQIAELFGDARSKVDLAIKRAREGKRS